MAATAPAAPGLPSNLRVRQNEPEHLERLRAFSYRYAVAQRWRTVRLFGTTVLALLAPFVVWQADRSISDLLAALAAGWLVLGRTFFQVHEAAAYRSALVQHELYEVELFGLPWNSGMCGRAPNTADVVEDARRRPMTPRTRERYLDWFTVDLTAVPYPLDVLVCQRQALIWSRKDVRRYAQFLITAGATCFLFGVAVAVGVGLSLAEYLVALCLPSAPALLDIAELARAHLLSAKSGDGADDEVEGMLRAGKADPTAVDIDACRSVQDLIFRRRLESQRVPNWFYRLRRKRSDELSRDAAGR